jgi:hypothetical protein
LRITPLAIQGRRFLGSSAIIENIGRGVKTGEPDRRTGLANRIVCRIVCPIGEPVSKFFLKDGAPNGYLQEDLDGNNRCGQGGEAIKFLFTNFQRRGSHG